MPRRTLKPESVRPSRGLQKRTATIARISTKKKRRPPASETVEVRARELAAIAGRNANRPTASDRLQAKRELMDKVHQDLPENESDIDSTWGSPPVSKGHRTRQRGPKDDETTSDLVQEGVDEAEHSQMLEGHRTNTRNTGK